MYGVYDTIENRPALRFERRLSHPVEVVWRAVTESDELEQWFPSRVEVDELRPGAEMTFRFENMPLDAPSTMTGRITEFDPPRVFEFEPAGSNACVLRLTVLLDQREKAARDGAGWHVCLDRLGRKLAGAEPGGREDWRDLYEEYQRRGAPAGAPIPGE
jgi:activator of Hsp90 ATPase-like protein